MITTLKNTKGLVVMLDNIRPYVIKIDAEDQYQEHGDLPFGQSPDERWVVDYEVVLGDMNVVESYRKLNPIKKLYARNSVGKFMNRKDGYLGIFFFTVCSPAYFKDPVLDRHSPGEIKRAFVQKIFNESEVERELNDRVNAIGECSVNEMSKELKKFLDTTQWDED